jgi:hypothetical protein
VRAAETMTTSSMGEPSVDGLINIAARKMPRTRALVNSGEKDVVFQPLG